LTNPEVTSTAYPAQRLQDIAVEVLERMVSQTPVEITLLPVWPSGEDELNPLMRSPVSGAPSTMLVDIAGSFDNVRFSDGCSGSVAVSSDGLSAMALSVSTDCQIRAKVGNFTDLESNSFRITTRN
ncbi:MAG TPA: serine/threonine protein kinase, partial [Beutenbergiaceae bacterium]|nr:serine/threonine protein kinase [Beutenbergiaceae bacterium]